MKVYVIYDTENEEHPEMKSAVGPFGETFLIAAFTESEEYARIYVECRKKKVFKIKKYKLSKKEFTKLCNNFALRKLQKFKLTTRIKGTHTSATEAKVIMTPSEYNIVTETASTFGCEHMAFQPVEIFKDKYARALMDLEYRSISMLNMNNVSYDFCDFAAEVPDASLDEVAVYVAHNINDFK